MIFIAGQGLFGKITFVDGSSPAYDRAYLIVSVSQNCIGTLNISSLAGKEHKLLYKTNKEIINHSPPFTKRSFVKLDSLTYISISDATSMHLLSNGQLLDANELKKIISMITSLKK